MIALFLMTGAFNWRSAKALFRDHTYTTLLQQTDSIYMLILKTETLHIVYQMQGVFGMMGFIEVNWI